MGGGRLVCVWDRGAPALPLSYLLHGEPVGVLIGFRHLSGTSGGVAVLRKCLKVRAFRHSSLYSDFRPRLCTLGRSGQKKSVASMRRACI